ncbi:MAG: hypothetical protein AB1413_02665 [Thermodesulfobacteriota bacterium]
MTGNDAAGAEGWIKKRHGASGLDKKETPLVSPGGGKSRGKIKKMTLFRLVPILKTGVARILIKNRSAAPDMVHQSTQLEVDV